MCTYADIEEKLKKISLHNKAWSSTKSNNGRNTIVIQDTNNLTTDEMHEELAHMRTG